MTIENVRERIKEIKDVYFDDEKAHSLEDRLLKDVVRAIAAGKTDDPRGIAREVLKAQNVVFARWGA